MKKLFFFLAALMFSFAAHATVVECSPNTNAISWWLTQGDTLVLADGEYVEDYSITFDKPGVCVKAAEGAKPVIKLTGEWTDFNVTATTTFDGITFDGGGVAKYFLATTGAETGTLTVTNCEFKNWAYWAISNQFESAASIDSVIVDNCLFHDGLGSAIRFNDAAPEGKHSCNYLKVTNSTFYNIVSTEYAAVIQANSNGEATGEQNEVIIDHITLYNFDASQLGAIAMRKSSKLSITNSIIATPENKDQYAFYIYGGNVENTLYFNGKAKSGPTYTNCIEGQDPLFVDAANANFALAEGSPALAAATDGSNLGDPRWNKSTTVDPDKELPAASVRAWAYDLALSVEGEQYTFSYKATTAALATLIFTDAEGVELATKELGLVEAGANNVVIAASELPADKEVNWAVKLEAGAIAELVEVTDQTRGIYDFYNMMDVLVDNNPDSENFGKIYIQMAYDGADDAATDRSAVQKAGFYLYDQTLNELNPESNVSIRPTLPEGYTMGDNRNKFHRLDIDPKTGNLTWCYNMAGQPAVFAVDAANLAGEAINLVAGIEGLSRTAAHCFDAEGALYVMDLPAAGTIYKIVDGVATVFAATDSKWVNASLTLAADGMGGLWVAQNRGQIDTYYQLAHYTKDGVLDYAVYKDNENGFTGSSARGALAYDAERQLLAQGRNGKVEVYSVAYDAETGVPALTLVATTPTVGNNIDGLHFDYAGDLYVVNSSKEKFQKFAMPTDNNVCVVPASSKYAFEVIEPVEVVGTVKRAVQNGQEVIVLTHEADGAAHIYRVMNGVPVAEISQEGVVPVDPENPGSYLAISDIAVTEDGKLVANNYVRNQFAGTTPESGYKLGTSYYYIWNDLAGAPAVWFTSQTTARSSHGDVGVTFALKGTSTNAEILVTAVHNNNRAVRLAKYNIIDGQYVEPNIPGGQQSSEYYEYFGTHTKEAYYQEAAQGKQFQLSASPLGEGRWIMDGELVDPSEFVLPAVGENYQASALLTEDLGKKYNGATYVTVGEKVLMVAPYATPEGKLTGVEILDITGGLDAAQYVDQLFIDEAVEATAAATAVEVVEGDEATALLITLVADATIYSLEATLSNGPVYQIYEEEITNLVIDLDNLVLIGGPSSAFQVDVYLPLGEYNMSEDSYQLTAESSIAVMGSDATFIEGYAYEVDAFTPSAKAVVRCEWNGMLLEFHLTMTAAPLEATVVVVENALVEIEKYLLWGDMYDYALKMSGEWVNPEDGLTYPVLVEVPVYYPEATEPSEIMSTVTVGGWGDNDPWLGFGEGTLTVTTENISDSQKLITAKGIVQNPMAGVAIDITISGKLIPSALDNVQVQVKTVKMIKNNQLIIVKDGVEYNAQGAVIK